jgi:hypothetical protein
MFINAPTNVTSNLPLEQIKSCPECDNAKTHTTPRFQKTIKSEHLQVKSQGYQKVSHKITEFLIALLGSFFEGKIGNENILIVSINVILKL